MTETEVNDSTTRPPHEWQTDSIASMLYAFADEHPVPTVRHAMLEASLRLRAQSPPLLPVARDEDAIKQALDALADLHNALPNSTTRPEVEQAFRAITTLRAFILAPHSESFAPEAAERLREIRARCEEATPGPWNWEPRGVWTEHAAGFGGDVLEKPSPKDAATGTVGYVGDSYPRGINYPSENMEFIAHAREDIPYLLALLASRSVSPLGSHE